MPVGSTQSCDDAWNIRVLNTPSSRRSIDRAGNGRLSEMAGLPEPASPSIARKPSAQLNVRSASCSEARSTNRHARFAARLDSNSVPVLGALPLEADVASQRPTLGNSQAVPARNRNKALAIRQIKAHRPTTTERPSASIGGVDASCAPAQPAAERQTCQINDPQDNHRHSNIASRKRRSISASRPRGCRSASAEWSFCERPRRSMLLVRSTNG